MRNPVDINRPCTCEAKRIHVAAYGGLSKLSTSHSFRASTS